MALVAGSMLGIGIFIAPPEVAKQVEGPGAFLLLWIAGGASALFGALSVAELGAMMPRAGGDYTYLRRAYGPGFAFAAGWLQLLAIFPGSLAAMAVGTATFQFPVIFEGAYLVPAQLGIPIPPEMFWAMAIVVGLTALNHVGVVISGRVQVALTGVPLAMLLVASLAIVYEFGVGGGAWTRTGGQMELPTLSSAALAFLPVYFAYSGWNAAIFVGAEIRDPGRNLPRALVGGTIAVTLLYFILCVGFLAVFSMDALANTGEAGTAAAQALFGDGGRFVVTTLILLAMLGSINGTVLTGSRISYAMAKHGDCLPAAGKLHSRYRTPAVALWLQAGWALVLIASQSFEQLLNYTSAAMLIAGTLTVMAVVVLRRKLPQIDRPYKTWGYPVTPVLYAGSSVAVLAILANNLDPSVFLGGGWFLAALLFHRFVLRRRPHKVGNPETDTGLATDPPGV